MSNEDKFDDVEDTAPHDRAKDERRRYTDWRQIERGLRARPNKNRGDVGEWDPEK